MRTHLLTILAICCISLLLSGCGDSTTKSAEAACVCEKGEAGESVWCESCDHGFVGGKEVACKDCYQGKTGAETWCEGCKKGYVEGKSTGCKDCFAGKTGTDVFCESCKAGYMDGEKVTKCKSCFDAKQGGPACEACAAKKATK